MILAGLLLSLLGIGLDVAFGGVNELQMVTTPEEFERVALASGNDVRWASWADILVFVAGYVLFLGGLLLRWVSAGPRLSMLGLGTLVVAAIADQVENTMVQLGLGQVDLDAPGAALNPAGWLIAVQRTSFTIKWAAVAVTLVAVITLGVQRLRSRHVIDL